jgi:phosphoenolpyruvate---glycerone phosphotransferase subunit DhaL
MSITRDDVISWLNACGRVLAENKAYLTQLDSDIGDADHGANMDRGFKSALAKLPTVADKDIGTLFKSVGMTLVSTVGGASGPLYGTFFMQAGTSAANKMELSAADWAAAFEAALNGVIARGKASLGDKTMVDALTPALNAFKQAMADGIDLNDCLRRSAAAAEQGMKDTIPLVARKGRASYLGERSAGHQDPGATSSFLILKAAVDTWVK